jgi:hypothetical protein
MNPVLRRSLAVVAGFVAVAVLSIGTDAALHAAGVFPPVSQPMSRGLFALAATYRALLTVAGGAIATWLAQEDSYRPAQILSFLGLLGGLAGVVVWVTAQSDLGPLWYVLSIPLSAIPCTLVGAWLVLRR